MLDSMGMTDPEMRAAQLPDFFAKMDLDRDGRISIHDFAAAAATFGLTAAPQDESAPSGSDDEDDVPVKKREPTLAERAAALFDQLDSDKSGVIDQTELEAVLVGLGLPAEAAEKQAFKLMVKLDVDGDGDIDRDEFLALASDPAFSALLGAVQVGNDEHDDEDNLPLSVKAERLFDELDEDGSGALQLPELEQILERLGLTDRAERRQQAQVMRGNKPTLKNNL
jgi:Ca2+-binding EF-hand superfamily protein